MISYCKLFELMKEKGKNTSHIRNNNVVGQETLRKLKIGTGILEEYNYKIPGTKPAQYEKRTRETSVDSKSIEALCTWLNCQPHVIIINSHIYKRQWNRTTAFLFVVREITELHYSINHIF